MPSDQARYWILTIPIHDAHTISNAIDDMDSFWGQYLVEPLVWAKGQAERGNNTGYVHWQLVVGARKPIRLRTIRSIFGNSVHAEPTRSKAAEDYVWKDDTRIPNTQFEVGQKTLQRNSKKDWESIKTSAKNGQLEQLPADIYVKHYRTLKQIEKDHLRPIAIEREIIVYWGPPGIGKSRKAWDEAGLDAYPKDPRTKYWDGYQGQENVVIDEFRGGIDISHILRWFDRYPVIIETKFGATVLKAKKIWLTSNLNPRDWYKDLDEDTKGALLRRLNIIHMIF